MPVEKKSEKSENQSDSVVFKINIRLTLWPNTDYSSQFSFPGPYDVATSSVKSG